MVKLEIAIEKGDEKKAVNVRLAEGWQEDGAQHMADLLDELLETIAAHSRTFRYNVKSYVKTESEPGGTVVTTSK